MTRTRKPETHYLLEAEKKDHKKSKKE